MSTTTVQAAQLTVDPLVTKARADLAVFTGWLARNNARGYIGEVGWPDNTRGEAASWNQLANVWYADANAAGLWVTNWATGSWWGTSYQLSSYQDRVAGFGVDSANTQAAVIEANGSAGGYMRGVNVTGGEFGTGGGFSNTNPGTYGTQYIYDPSATFSYLYSRGVRVVRLPFRWERIQPSLGGALDGAELGRLRDAVARAGASGLGVIIDMHNYGEYQSGGRQTIGQGISSAQFANVWAQIAAQFRTNGSVVAYDLMNEPHDMGGGNPAGAWEAASQAAVSAIRAGGDNKLVMVEGYNWASAAAWSSTHPTAWINDPAGNIRYEAHQYFDRDNSGVYASTYVAEVQNAASRGYIASVVAQAPAPVAAPAAGGQSSGGQSGGKPAASTGTAGSAGQSPAAGLTPSSSPTASTAPVAGQSGTAGTPSAASPGNQAAKQSAASASTAPQFVLSASHVALKVLVPLLVLIIAAFAWFELHVHRLRRTKLIS